MSADDWDKKYQYDDSLMDLMMTFGRDKPNGFKPQELIKFLESQGYTNANQIVDSMYASQERLENDL